MELLIMVIDRTNPGNAFKDAKLYKRGMVVDAHDDGWNWGNEELTNPVFRIFKLPSISLTQAAPFLQMESGYDTADSATTVKQPRAFKLNLTAAGLATLPTAVQAYIADDTRAQAFWTISLGAIALRNAFLALKTAVPPLPNPLVL